MVNTRLKVGEYEARIVVEGKNIAHYGIEVNEERMVATCWIPSTAGKVGSIILYYFNPILIVDLALRDLGDKTP